jgi:uncharacterized protein YchJ
MVQLNKTTKYLTIKYYEENEKVTQEEVSKIFRINVRTFQRWLYNYKENQQIQRKPRIMGSYKVKKNMLYIHLK